MSPKKWKDLSSEEKKEVYKKQAARKRARDERDAYYEAKQKFRYACDKLGDQAQIGDWLRYQEEYGTVSLNGKVCRILAWDDDGHNHKRAGRNKKIVVEVEPHLNKHPETMRTTFYGFTAINEMEVIAEAAR